MNNIKIIVSIIFGVVSILFSTYKIVAAKAEKTEKKIEVVETKADENAKKIAQSDIHFNYIIKSLERIEQKLEKP